jgi:hypothetical protein
MILTGQHYELGNSYDVLCEHCKKVVGQLSRAECSELSAKDVEVICNDCDSLWADTTPPHLTPGKSEAVFIFGQEGVTILSDTPQTIANLLGSLMKELRGPCLSSSTYVSHCSQESQGKHDETP